MTKTFKLTIVLAFLTFGDLSATTLAGDTLARVKGKVINSTNEEGIKAKIIYEKLPYGDDMGLATAQLPKGVYTMYMLKNGKYLVSISASGFKKLEEEILIDQLNDDGEFVKDFALVPATKEEVMRLENLLFASGRSEISQSSHEELDELAALMHEKPSMVIQLEGHTDFAGNAEANMQLSKERVEAVRDYLGSKGIKKKRVLVQAFGGTQPLTQERSSEGRRQNRRVEVRIIQE